MNQQLNIDMSKQPDVTCDECGGLDFVQAMRFKTISGILVGKKEAQLTPVQVIACIKCGHVNTQFLPVGIYDEKESKPKSKIQKA